VREYACSSFRRSSFSIVSIASIARFEAAASGPPSIRPRKFGTICHDSPNLSFSHPHSARRAAFRGEAGLRVVDFFLGFAPYEERDGLREDGRILEAGPDPVAAFERPPVDGPARGPRRRDGNAGGIA
jgi:hypothetical protein